MDLVILFSLLSLFIVGYTTWTNAYEYNTFAATVTSIGGNEGTIMIASEQAVTDNLIIPANIMLRFIQGGSLNISVGKTVTINGHVEAGLYQIFKGDGTVSFGDGSVKEAPPIWWYSDGDFAVAVNAAITAIPLQAKVVITPGAEIEIDTTIEIDRAVQIEFNKRNLNYTGAVSAVVVSSVLASFNGLSLTTTQDFANANLVGCEFLTGRRSTYNFSKIHNFTVGVKIQSELASGIAHNNFYFDHQMPEVKKGLVMGAVAPGFVSANNFYGFETQGTEAVGSVGIEAGEKVFSNHFYAPVIQLFEKGVSDNSTLARGNFYMTPYMESCGLNFETGADCLYLTVLGGAFITNYFLIKEEDIGNADCTIITLDPFRRSYYIFPFHGLFEGEVDGFANLLTNGHFENWIDATHPDGWSYGIREDTIKISGEYSLKQDATAATKDSEQALDAYNISNLQGKYLTVGGWIYNTVAEKASFYIDDGVDTQSSGVPDAINTWEFKTATLKIDDAAAQVKIICKTITASLGYFENLIAVEGRNVPVFTPKPISDLDYLVGSLVWDPGNLADGDGETSGNITVTGAAVTDRVEVYPPYSLQAVLCMGYVSAADTVNIRLQNETGGAINTLASGTWRVKVFRY